MTPLVLSRLAPMRSLPAVGIVRGVAEPPSGKEFTQRWRELSADERKKIARLANAGETSADRDEATLVAGLAAKRSRPIELVSVLVASLLGYILVAQSMLDGPEPAVLFGLGVGITAFLIFQRRRLLVAHSKSLNVLRRDR